MGKRTTKTAYSFLIVSRNSSDTILTTIKSIRNVSAGKKIEIVLVDDCSRDNTVSIATPLCDVVLVNEKRKGIGFSRQRGLRSVSSGKVFIIDSDIEIKSIDYRQIDHLFSQGIAAISGSYSSEGGDSNWNKALDLRRKYIYFKDNNTLVADRSRYVTFSGGFCVIDIKRVGGIEYFGKMGTSGEDILFQLKLLHRGLKTAYSPAMVGSHHHVRNTKSAARKIWADAAAYPWLISECIKNRIGAPILEQAFNYPIFLTASFFVTDFYIKFILVFLELFPQIYVIFAEKLSGNSLRLFIYALIQSYLKIFMCIREFIIGNHTFTEKYTYIKNLLFSDLLSKYRWLKLFVSEKAWT